MAALNRRLVLSVLVAGCAMLPAASQAYPYGYGFRGGYGYGGFGVGLGVGLLAGGLYGGYYAPRPYYAVPPVVYAPPPVYYAPPIPPVAYQVPAPPLRRAPVHHARAVRRAPPACVAPPALTGPLPRGPLENPLSKPPAGN